MRLPGALRLRLRPGGSAAAAAAAAGPGYRQGQSPDSRTREYFYYVDHQGQLFLDDAKVKNFITCFKDVKFLAFFFTQLRRNRSGRYEAAFPYVSPCGRERNYVRCDDRPVVFTELLRGAGGAELLSYCGGGERLAVPFEPARLLVLPESGRLYHPAPAAAGGAGLVRSALAFEWSGAFEHGAGAARPPTHFAWRGRRYELTHELLPLLRAADAAHAAP